MKSRTLIIITTIIAVFFFAKWLWQAIPKPYFEENITKYELLKPFSFQCDFVKEVEEQVTHELPPFEFESGVTLKNCFTHEDIIYYCYKKELKWR